MEHLSKLQRSQSFLPSLILYELILILFKFIGELFLNILPLNSLIIYLKIWGKIILTGDLNMGSFLSNKVFNSYFSDLWLHYPQERPPPAQDFSLAKPSFGPVITLCAPPL